MDRPLEEWRNFELYEKIRIRENRKRFWIIASVSTLFLSLCAVPVVNEQLPKWKTLHAARVLSLELERLKTRSIQEKKPLRIRFGEAGQFKVEMLEDCKSETILKVDRDSVWPSEAGALKVLTRADLDHYSLPMGAQEICFDPVSGLGGAKIKRVLVIAPVKDLSESRLDRASYIELDGESAKISIN